jgi:hypothetical protein
MSYLTCADHGQPGSATEEPGTPRDVLRGRSGLILLCAAPTFACAGVAGAVPAANSSAYRIAFFGDSITVASGASDRKHGYVAHLWRWLQRRGKRVVANVNAKGGVPVATGRIFARATASTRTMPGIG